MTLFILKCTNRLLTTVVNALRRLFLPFLLRRGTFIDRGHRVIRISDSTVVKRVPMNIGRAEAETQRFISVHTSIPVPAVYDYWTKGGQTYIVMEYVHGRELRYWWKKLTIEQKKKIVSQLGEYIRELRSISPPTPAYIGRLIPGEPMLVPSLSEELFGPFTDEASFVNWRLDRIEAFAEGNVRRLERLREIRKNVRTNYQVMLTHGDLGPHNILIQCDGPRIDDVRIVAIIDWEMSGWMPEYWECIKCKWMARFKDLDEMQSEIFPDYKPEEELEGELYSMMPLMY